MEEGDEKRRGSEGRGSWIRAFFAVELSEAARRAAEGVARRLRERPGGDGVRWVRPEAWHVTLRFLGRIDASRVTPLARGASRELAGLRPFALRLGPAELFPTPRRPRVVALGLAPEAPLAELAEALERAVAAEGFAPEERPFRAHLTLGRVRERSFPAVDGIAAAPEEFEVEEVVLFRSELLPSGARYTPLERVPLGRAEPSEVSASKAAKRPRSGPELLWSSAKPSEVPARPGGSKAGKAAQAKRAASRKRAKAGPRRERPARPAAKRPRSGPELLWSSAKPSEAPAGRLRASRQPAKQASGGTPPSAAPTHHP